MSRITTFILLSALSSSGIAEPIKGDAELGFVSTSGNSDTENVNAKLNLEKATESWVHKAQVGMLKNESDDEKTAEKYNVGWQSDRVLGERSSFFVIATYEDDKFSGFDYQAAVGVGYGYKVVHGEEHSLTLEIGPGYRVNALENGDEEDETTLRLGEFYLWKFSETAELNQYLTIEGGDENTISRFGVSVKSALTGSLALKIGFDIKHTDEVPAGIDDTDSETYASVSYSF